MLSRFFLSPIRNMRDMIRHGEFPRPSYLTFFPLQHAMTCWSFYRLSKRRVTRRQSL